MTPQREITLRPYQEEALEAVRANMRRGIRRQILCLPTGAGKTVIAAEIMRAAAAKGSRCCFLIDRISLLRQTSEVLTDYGVPHGIVGGGVSQDTFESIVLGVHQTCERSGYPVADLYIYDEAHDVRRAFIEFVDKVNPHAIGLSATPFRPGLGKVYGGVVNGSTVNSLLTDGHLSPLVVYEGVQIDRDAIRRTSAGEYESESSGEEATKIVGDAVTEWIRHTTQVFGGPVQTLVACPSVAAAEHVAERFRESGHWFEHISYREGADVNADVIRRYRDGDILGLVQVDIASKGFDAPSTQCLVNLKPLRKSFARWIQLVGRVIRTAPDKEKALLIDHAGAYNMWRLSMAQYYSEGCESLEDGEFAKAKPNELPEASDWTCKECGFTAPAGAEIGDSCPACGAARKRRKPMPEPELGEFRYAGIIDGTEHVPHDLWPQISTLAMERHPADADRARSFALAQYKGIVGKWPGRNIDLDLSGAEVPMALRIEVRRNLKAWRKARK